MNDVKTNGFASVGGFTTDNDYETELIIELENLKINLLSRFDRYLKFQIQKRGVSIIMNTYTGFDTEYELKDAKKHLNSLVSVQTAVQTRLIVKIPLYNPYDISYVHPLTSEISNVYKNKVELSSPYKYNFIEVGLTSINLSNSTSKTNTLKFDELRLINNSIKVAIGNIRECLFSSNDEINLSIINKLKSLREVKGFESEKDFCYYEDLKRDQIIFILPLTTMVKKIVYPDNGFCLDDLLTLSDLDLDLTDTTKNNTNTNSSNSNTLSVNSGCDSNSNNNNNNNNSNPQLL